MTESVPGGILCKTQCIIFVTKIKQMSTSPTCTNLERETCKHYKKRRIKKNSHDVIHGQQVVKICRESKDRPTNVSFVLIGQTIDKETVKICLKT